MRLCTHDTQWLVKRKKLLGINLGWDYCAEHEWGIRILNKSFGINHSLLGTDKRIITQCPKGLKYIMQNNKYCLYFSRYLGDDIPSVVIALMQHSDSLTTAWSESDFCIVSDNEEYMLELHKAFLKNDILLFVDDNDNPFANGGLTFLINSRTSATIKQNMYDNDKAIRDLYIEAEATGIYELLKQHDKKYYALVPFKQDGKLVFWLNPQEQDKYKTNYFTLEDLQDWVEDKGKVLKV